MFYKVLNNIYLICSTRSSNTGKPLTSMLKCKNILQVHFLSKSMMKKKECTLLLEPNIARFKNELFAYQKICIALIIAIKKVKHYMLSHKINIVSKIDPLTYIMSRLIIFQRIGKWAFCCLSLILNSFHRRLLRNNP